MPTLNLTGGRLRILQGIAVLFAIVGMAVFGSNGKPLFAVVVGGIGFGILSFIPVGIVLLLYWAVSDPNPSEPAQRSV